MSSLIVILGAGGHAKVAAELAQSLGYEVCAFFDFVNKDRSGERFLDSYVETSADTLREYARPGMLALVAIGDCDARADVTLQFAELSFRFPVLVHPRAVVSPSAKIGEGTVIVAGAVINAAVVMGRHCIVNTSATVDHDCCISDFVHVAPGVHLAGHVTVGAKTFIGIGSVVKDRVRIGQHCLIGAGSLVVKDVPDNAVAYGSPARIVRENR